MKTKARIVFMTDFGADNQGVAVMEGVCACVDSELRCTNLTHSIPPFHTWDASMALDYVVPFWPQGTIFVSVVDPGVGTSRKACVARLKNGCYVVTPDNGTLTHLFYKIGIEEVREIDEKKNRWKGTESTSIFHGRDLFAYCAAKLAAGIINYKEIGSAYPVEEVVLHDSIFYPKVEEGLVEGIITSAMPHFGNLFTNVSVKDFEHAGFQIGQKVKVRIRHENQECFAGEILYHKSFGYVEAGEPILFNGSTLYICIALNQDNFVNKYHIKDGESWKVRIEK